MGFRALQGTHAVVPHYQTTEAPIVGPERFTLMPWHAYTRLTEPDLEVIFLYLKSRRAISNKVETHPAN
jgi:hypothetical protein